MSVSSYCNLRFFHVLDLSHVVSEIDLLDVLFQNYYGRYREEKELLTTDFSL